MGLCTCTIPQAPSVKKGAMNFTRKAALLSVCVGLISVTLLGCSGDDGPCETDDVSKATTCMGGLTAPTGTTKEDWCTYIEDYIKCYPGNCCTESVETSLKTWADTSECDAKCR